MKKYTFTLRVFSINIDIGFCCWCRPSKFHSRDRPF